MKKRILLGACLACALGCSMTRDEAAAMPVRLDTLGIGIKGF